MQPLREPTADAHRRGGVMLITLGAMIERVFGKRLLVGRSDLSQTKVDDGGPPPSLPPGGACFAVERVALTANNVTYGTFGDKMGYWRFFPAPDGFGIVPVWGVAKCIASEADGIAPGDRFFGYWPLAEMLVVETKSVSETGFVDPSSHRAGLSDIYNRYERRGAPASHTEALEALFRPLFMTGWLLAQWLERGGDFGATQVVVSSASSKTAMGLAWTHRRRSERPRLIGLTAEHHLAFVRSLGLYDEVMAYDTWADTLSPAEATAYIDICGNRRLRASIHDHFGEQLRQSTAVGATHGPPEEAIEVPGTAASFFFAPKVVAELQQDMGASAMGEAMHTSLAAFLAEAAAWVTIDTRKTIAESKGAFDQLVSGQAGGATSFVIEP